MCYAMKCNDDHWFNVCKEYIRKVCLTKKKEARCCHLLINLIFLIK